MNLKICITLLVILLSSSARGQTAPVSGKEDRQDISSARTLIMEGNYREAIRMLEKQDKQGTNGVRVLNDVGVAYFGMGDVGSAEKSFRAALALAPEMNEVRRNLAKTLQSAGKHTEAENELRKALETDRTDAKAMNDLAVVLNSVGKTKEAIVYATEALSFAPKDPLILCNLGIFYLAIRQGSKSVKHLRAALEYKKNYPEARYALALAYLSLNDRSSFLRQYSIIKYYDSDKADELMRRMSQGKVIYADKVQ